MLELSGQIVDLIEIQRRLFIGFLELYPSVQNEFDLTAIRPRRGFLCEAQTVWEFLQHGHGVSFTHVGHGTHVSMHEDFFDATKFDKWRLGLFLESRGFGSTLDLSTLLGEQVAGGLIRSVCYRRYQLAGPD